MKKGSSENGAAFFVLGLMMVSCYWPLRNVILWDRGKNKQIPLWVIRQNRTFRGI